MKKLSVVISAFNEEKKIEDCLKSVKFADEIIVVDNSSTDKTAEIAKRHTGKIFSQSNDPKEIDLQKNFGFSKATSDWILSIDADERVSPELQAELVSILKNQKTDLAGYWIPRKNIIFGKWIEHTGWYPDHQLRLFKRGSGRFESEHVHEPIKAYGELGYLKNHLIHENYDSINQFAQKTFIYAQNEAEHLVKCGYRFSFADVIGFPLREFLSRFFAREGYKDGFYGLILSLLMAFYHFLVFAYIWEIEKYKEQEEKDVLNIAGKEFGEAHRQINYWLLNTKLEKTGNIARKLLLRVKRKLSS